MFFFDPQKNEHFGTGAKCKNPAFRGFGDCKCIVQNHSSSKMFHVILFMHFNPITIPSLQFVVFLAPCLLQALEPHPA